MAFLRAFFGNGALAPAPPGPGEGPVDRFAVLAGVADRSSELIVITDDAGTVVYANPVALGIFHLSATESLGTQAFAFLHPDDAARVRERFFELVQTPGASLSDEVRVVGDDHHVHDLEILATNCLDTEIAGIVINGRDVSERHRLVEGERRFRLAFEQNMAPMLFVDLNDCITAANDAFCHMVGYASSDLVGRDSKHFTHPEDVGITEESWRHVSRGDVDQERYVKRYIRSDGEVLIVEVLRSLARDAEGNGLYYVISERDVTAERSLTARIYHQELHDPLTGLANRVLFEDRLIQAHARTQRTDASGAVVLIDVDDFKGVNDSHGLAFGDQVLVAIARRLESVKRPSDTLSRLGGDGFLYLAEGLEHDAEAEAVAEMLLGALAQPFTVGDVSVELRASAGVVVWDATSRSPTEFIRDADVAVDEAKSLGRARHVVFTPLMHEQAINRFAIVQDLHRALEKDEIVMHYQPIFDLATAEIVGYEALMRWHHPEHGWVAPSEFIPLAEQSGMILELGDLALRAATTDASTWPASATSLERPFVTVNLSASQFHDPRLVATVEAALATSALSPDRLVIEITEGVLLSDTSETTNVLGRLHEFGVHFALDDFGTGFSSLSYLTLLHPRVIKIDQSFVRLARPSSRNDALLETIISLGEKLGITTLAEGIETAAQYRHLRRLGCTLGQGFLFSPAVANEDLAALHFSVPVA